MKKVSVFGLLAMIVAVASSFTALKRIPTDSWFLLQTPVAQATFQSNYSSTYNRTSAFVIDAATMAPKRNTQAQVQSPALCPTGIAKVCAVQIDYAKSAPLAELNGIANGDFTNFHTTDIVGYQFRSN